MVKNKTHQTEARVDGFMSTVSAQRQAEARILINMMQDISGLPAKMWGPSIIGFGSQQYKYDSGRKGVMPLLAFSPRKSSITIYFSEGFDRYSSELSRLGKHKLSVSCLYINKLDDIDLKVLQRLVDVSYRLYTKPQDKPTTVDEYISRIPKAARPKFDELRATALELLPQATEVISYGIVGYKIDKKMARVFISGWKDHVSIYPVPKDPVLQAQLEPYIRGKGTLWFALDTPLPDALIRDSINSLTS